jgi:alpha-tubulin suppressor-like RCC1 family protein
VNNDRRLGTGDTITSVAPVAVTGGLTFASVDAGGAHTCGISTAAIAYCWGSNENGALGSAPGSETCLTLFVPRTSIPCSATPVAVGGGLAFASLDVSEAGQHTCALTETGTAYCWGRGGQGQIGSGGTTGDPQIVPGVPDFVSVSAGADHSCGVTGGGEAYCWGGNVNGQLGHGTNGQQDVAIPPLPVVGGIVFEPLSAASFYTCRVDTTGSAYCWSKDSSQQLGTATGQVNVPSPVFGAHIFASVSVSWFHTCGVDTDGVAFCWGANEFGQLGTGTTGDRGTPARVVGQL